MLVLALNLFQNVSCTFVIKAILFSLTPRELYAILHEYVCIIIEFFLFSVCVFLAILLTM